MRIFLWILALLTTAVGLAVTARFNPANVVLFYPPYRIDLSLNFFLLLLVLLFVLIHVILRGINTTKELPARVAAYRQQKQERESHKSLREALKAFFEGRFGHAEKAALRAEELPENAGLAALIGARAAHRLRQPERRDGWLAKIAQDKNLKIARLMSMTELLVDDHQANAALEAVKELNANGARHIHALQWALKANQQAKNWPEVLRLVKMLDKHHAIHPGLSSRLRELAYEDLFSNPAQDDAAIRQLWQSMPSEDRKQAFIAVRVAKAFNDRNLHNEARMIVEQALQDAWDERLVRAYRASAAEEGSPALLAQINCCEAWLASRPSDDELTLTLGTLCLKQKLWGKAQHYLEQALSTATEPKLLREIHLNLAQLHEALDNNEEAKNHYKQCALIAVA